MKKVLVLLVSMPLVAGLVFSQAYKGKGRVKGVVKDEDGQSILQVAVKLYHINSDSGFEVLTDEKGEWTASWLRNGLWNIDFQKEGYLPRRISLNISEIKKNPDVEVSLKKARAPLVPKELLDKLDEGNKLFDEGRYDEAVASFENILASRPEFYQININIGNAYMQKEDYEQALAYFQRVLEKDPQNVEALVSSGNCYIELKENEKALALFKQIDRNDINNATTLYNIGTIFYNNGEVDMAIQYYEQSIVVQNDFVESYYQLGLAYLGRGDKENSLKNFQKYLEIDSTSEKAEQVKKFIEYLQKN